MLRPIFASAAAILLLTGCAVFAQAQDLESRSPQDATLIAATCTNVMGLKRGQEFYQDCQESLAHSLAQRDAAYAMAASGETCRALGLAPGSSALATCMLDKEGAAAAPRLQPVALTSETVEPGRSYYTASARAQLQRQRYACAQLGLMPNSGLFGACVASLQGALQPYSG